MTEKELKISKTSTMLIALTKKSKAIAFIVIIYFIILVLYDLIVFNRPFTDIIITYFSVIIIGFFVWFGVQFVFWLQIKNGRCPEKFLNIIVIAALIVYGTSSVFMGVQFFINGDIFPVFIAPIAFLSVVKTQLAREKTG
jgi:hypothetical protein